MSIVQAITGVIEKTEAIIRGAMIPTNVPRSPPIPPSMADSNKN